MARKTYEMGHRRRKSRRIIIAVIVLAVLCAGFFYGYKQFQQETKPVINNSGGSTHAEVIPNSQVQHFDEGNFAFDAPVDWKLTRHDTAPYNLYGFQSTLKNADNRYLDIYADSLPLTMAVNKAVAVRPEGNKLSHGMASENCTTFTQAASTGGSKPLSIVAKWDGVEFLCNNDTTTRNVIGTSAPASINKVALTTPTSGTHSFFFVYTDNNYNPDYSIFYNMLDSFMLK